MTGSPVEGTMKRSLFVSAALALIFAASAGDAQQGARGGEWRYHGGDLGATKYSPLDQINKANVSNLKIAWPRPAADGSILAANPGLSYSRNFHATPIMV